MNYESPPGCCLLVGLGGFVWRPINERKVENLNEIAAFPTQVVAPTIHSSPIVNFVEEPRCIAVNSCKASTPRVPASFCPVRSFTGKACQSSRRRKAVGHRHHQGESFPLILNTTGSLLPAKTDFCQILPNRLKMAHEHNEHLPT